MAIRDREGDCTTEWGRMVSLGARPFRAIRYPLQGFPESLSLVSEDGKDNVDGLPSSWRRETGKTARAFGDFLHLTADA
jgi:hypothetical protein